ncbi:DUF4148 domain-containing protein [Paraburkholderia sp. J94]|uniref:DUF4148 domain-containing protein n=1 Tax=Paraburkholderia sp. J94 TaxID=2805441 RepID=UPI002AB1F208|nr:DUF4148 domain-containing protein [Paraburkholderia sp. J94]
MNLVRTLVAAAVVAVPALSFAAQPAQQGLTRAQVRAELVQLQQAGYRQSSDNNQYPVHLQAALARIAASQDVASANAPTHEANANANANANAVQTSFGGVTSGSSASGSRVKAAHATLHDFSGAQADQVGLEPIYAHS